MFTLALVDKYPLIRSKIRGSGGGKFVLAMDRIPRRCALELNYSACTRWKGQAKQRDASPRRPLMMKLATICAIYDPLSRTASLEFGHPLRQQTADKGRINKRCASMTPQFDLLRSNGLRYVYSVFMVPKAYRGWASEA
jgi:hypothetical protein